MQTFVNSGDMAPLILFYDGPAHWNFANLMSSFYGTGSTPSFFCNGSFEQTGWNQSACQNAINNALATPAYLGVDCSIAGDATSGTVFYNFTAEQDLQSNGMIRVLSVITESDIYAASGWYYYNGKTLDWIPRMAPLGVLGIEIEFEGPYPQTISVQGEYNIEAGWDFENMGLLTFVIDYSDKSVFNASFDSDLGSIMGIEDTTPDMFLSVGPNPSMGTINISAVLPGNSTGTIEVFNLAGRMVASGSTSEMRNVTVEESGIYLVRLSTPDGMSVTESVAVIR